MSIIDAYLDGTICANLMDYQLKIEADRINGAGDGVLNFPDVRPSEEQSKLLTIISKLVKQ